MADQLVASMTGEFSPEDYHDEYRAALMAMIEAKVGGESPAPVKHAEPTKIGDLMAALEQSVATARDARREAAAKPGDAPARTKKAAAKPSAAASAKKTAHAPEPARRRKSA